MSNMMRAVVTFFAAVLIVVMAVPVMGALIPVNNTSIDSLRSQGYVIYTDPTHDTTRAGRTYYTYAVDAGFNTTAIHDTILASNYTDICLAAYQWTLTSNFTPVQAEIIWIRSHLPAANIIILESSTTTRTGYDDDSVYRRYESWSSRNTKLATLYSCGVDMYIIDASEQHFSSPSDTTAFFTYLNKLCINNGLKFAVYDGDAFQDVLYFTILQTNKIYTFSDIYINAPTYLRSSCNWTYPYIVTQYWLGAGGWQFNSAEDITSGNNLLIGKNVYANLVNTYDYNGTMPVWAYR